MTTEQPPPQWLRVREFPDYEVNDLGQVRSMRRGKPRVLKARPQAESRKGNLPYLVVALYGDEGRRDRHVAHLVLETFVGPRPTAAEVRHLNSNPQDNRLSNLAWGTRRDNANDRNERRTHCRNGHELGGWTKNGAKRARRCKTCARERYHAKAG